MSLKLLETRKAYDKERKIHEMDEVLGKAKSKYPDREPYVEKQPFKRRVLVV